MRLLETYCTLQAWGKPWPGVIRGSHDHWRLIIAWLSDINQYIMMLIHNLHYFKLQAGYRSHLSAGLAIRWTIFGCSGHDPEVHPENPYLLSILSTKETVLVSGIWVPWLFEY